MEPIKTYLLPNETVLLENNANSIVNQGVAKGGKLVLTDKRIFFVAHKFNIGSKFEEYKISEITMKDNKYLLFSENRNLKINMVDGRMVAFVLGKKYSAIWKEKIVEVLSSQMQMFQEHKKEEKPQYEIILSGVPINIEMYKDTLGIRKLNEKINYQNPQQASMVLERINSGQMFLSLVGRKFGERINAIQNGNDDIKFCIVCHSVTRQIIVPTYCSFAAN